MRQGIRRGRRAQRAQSAGARVGLSGLHGREAKARALAAQYQAFLGRSERLARAWQAFASTSPANRAELELALRRAEDALAGPRLTQLREAAERELCRSYARHARLGRVLGRPRPLTSRAASFTIGSGRGTNGAA